MSDDVARYDAYNQKVSDASKPAIAAVVVLNSGAWLALMSQISSLLAIDPAPNITGPFLLWAAGAAIGAFIWLIAYVQANLVLIEFNNSGSNSLAFWIKAVPIIGVLLVVLSISLFLCGVVILANSFA